MIVRFYIAVVEINVYLVHPVFVRFVTMVEIYLCA